MHLYRVYICVGWSLMFVTITNSLSTMIYNLKALDKSHPFDCVDGLLGRKELIGLALLPAMVQTHSAAVAMVVHCSPLPSAANTSSAALWTTPSAPGTAAP